MFKVNRISSATRGKHTLQKKNKKQNITEKEEN